MTNRGYGGGGVHHSENHTAENVVQIVGVLRHHELGSLVLSLPYRPRLGSGHCVSAGSEPDLVCRRATSCDISSSDSAPSNACAIAERVRASTRGSSSQKILGTREFTYPSLKRWLLWSRMSISLWCLSESYRAITSYPW